MRENYGLICCWNTDNNCFMACSPDYPLCVVMGKTRVEAVTALDTEIRAWQDTAREIGINTPSASDAPKEIATRVDVTASPAAKVSARKRKPDTRQSLVQKIQKGLAELQQYEAVSDIPLDIEISDSPCIVRLHGEIEFRNVQNIREQVIALTHQHKHIVFDLGQIKFIDSAGLALLVEVSKRVIRADGFVCIVLPQEKGNQVERILKLGRFDTIMHLCSSLEKAKELVTPAGV